LRSLQIFWLAFFVFIFSRNPGSIQEDDRLEDEVNFNSLSFALTVIYDKVELEISE